MDETDETSGAEQAFDNLRAQVTVMRQAVEALPRAWEKSRPVDTTETLGQMVQALRAVGDKLVQIEQHPAMRMTPHQYATAVISAGAGLMSTAVQKFDRASDEAVRERQALAAMIGTMDGQRRQLEQLLWTGCGALVLGLLISPLFARLLPFGWDGQVAAFILRGDRLQAGAELMAAGSPEAWRTLSSAAELQKANAAALAACREAAAKTKKEQHCTVVVPAP